MKDSEARAVINLLTNRIGQLAEELRVLQENHPKNCDCKVCSGYTPDHFSIDIQTIHGGKYAPWWKR